MTRDLDIHSAIASSTTDKVTIKGMDLCEDLLGKVSVGDMAFLEIKDRLPTEKESVMFNALMLTLVEHGITASSLATRMVYAGAPEATQAAIAAGLLGLGSRFVGSMEHAAKLLQEHGTHSSAATVDADAKAIVDLCRSANRTVPGIGHAIHKPLDPRAVRLFALADELGFSGNYTALMKKISDVAEQALGKNLPVNATGAIAAIATEMDISWKIIRGIGVAARAIGLLGHIKEEAENPIAMKIKKHVQEIAEGEA